MSENIVNASINFDLVQQQLSCRGNWALSGIKEIVDAFDDLAWPSGKTLRIDAAQIDAMDSAGAWLFHRVCRQLKQSSNTLNVEGLKHAHHKIIELVASHEEYCFYRAETSERNTILYKLGEETHEKVKQTQGLVSLIGELTTNFFSALKQWRRFQFPSIVTAIDTSGYQALPILALLSFLIGVVLTYQMGLQLQTYGANVYIAYLSGLAIFREFGPLITAIIVAGRTSSSFTAQIGTMKVKEEIDALKTMGLSVTERLVLPKVLGLMIAFPLLIFWSDIFGVLGSMVISKSMLDVGHIEFLSRLKQEVGVEEFWVGLSKAPVFALLIATVGCFQGFLVSASADSVGARTTKSVVQALFLIIIADAAFSVYYSWMGI